MSESPLEQARRWVKIWSRAMQYYGECCAQEVLAHKLAGARRNAAKWDRSRTRFMRAWTRTLAAERAAAELPEETAKINWFGDEEGGSE